MYLILNTAIFIALISPLITHLFWRKKWKESRKGRAYIRKYLWGLRKFLFPALSIYILLATDLKTFCVALFGFWLVSFALKLVFGADNKFDWRNVIGYFWFIPLAMTWSYNEPFWIQIWPNIYLSFVLGLSVMAMLFRKPHWLLPNMEVVNTFPNFRGARVMLYGMFISSSVLLIGLNEFFRRQASFETWAVFNAFSIVFLVSIAFVCTIIFVPMFFGGKEPIEISRHIPLRKNSRMEPSSSKPEGDD